MVFLWTSVARDHCQWREGLSISSCWNFKHARRGLQPHPSLRPYGIWEFHSGSKYWGEILCHNTGASLKTTSRRFILSTLERAVDQLIQWFIILDLQLMFHCPYNVGRPVQSFCDNCVWGFIWGPVTLRRVHTSVVCSIWKKMFAKIP